MSISTPPDKRAAEFGWPGGDHPGEVAFTVPVSVEVRSAIFAALAPLWPDLAAAELTALTPPDGVIGRYRLATATESRFVRVSARWGDPALEQAITGWLQDDGIAVNHLQSAGLRVAYRGEEFRLDVRAFVAGRHFDSSAEDLHSLSAALLACHLRLREFPQIEAVRAHAVERAHHLEATRRLIAEALLRRDWAWFSDDETWAATHAEWLGGMVDSFDPFFDRLPGAQVLHAQIHRANVLFDSGDAHPVLVDFEEAIQTLAPVTWDLAYFLQRFCLHDEPSTTDITRRLAVVRAAYGEWPAGVVEMMRQTAWLSIAIIVSNRHNQGIVNPPAEYQKFVTLERQACSLAPVLEGGGAC